VGRAPLLLAAIDRPPTRGLARGGLVESPPERRLHARRSLERGTVVGSGRAPQRDRVARAAREQSSNLTMPSEPLTEARIDLSHRAASASGEGSADIETAYAIRSNAMLPVLPIRAMYNSNVARRLVFSVICSIRVLATFKSSTCRVSIVMPRVANEGSFFIRFK